jgi:hypothetical protein
MWHYLTSADMKFFKDLVSKEFYWKLSHQCRARIPMLKVAYLQLIKELTDES